VGDASDYNREGTTESLTSRCRRLRETSGSRRLSNGPAASQIIEPAKPLWKKGAVSIPMWPSNDDAPSARAQRRSGSILLGELPRETCRRAVRLGQGNRVTSPSASEMATDFHGMNADRK